MLPSLDAHSSAEVVKGSSAPAHWRSSSRCKQKNGDVFTTHVSASHTHTHANTSPVCMSSSCVAVTTCCRFPFCLPLEPRADSRQRRSRNQNRGRMENDISPGLSFHLWVNNTHGSPTCSHLSSSKCRPIVLICLQGGKRETCLICEGQRWGHVLYPALATFLPRVGWEDKHRSFICPLNRRMQPAPG